MKTLTIVILALALPGCAALSNLDRSYSLSYTGESGTTAEMRFSSPRGYSKDSGSGPKYPQQWPHQP